METKDIQSALTISNTEPEEAAQNISRSRLFETTPDTYKNLKTQLDPQFEAVTRTPATIEPATQELVTKSEQHLALAKNDLPQLNAFERRWKYYTQQVLEVPEINRQINEIRERQLLSDDGTLSEADQQQVEDLNTARNEMSQNDFGVDPSNVEKFLVDAASGVGDIARTYWKNKEIIGGAVGTGAVIGAAAGFFIPVPGATAAGAKIGAAQGATIAGVTVPVLDGYRQARNSLYHELSYATDENGAALNLPHDRKKLVSQGVGVLSAVASGFVGKALVSNNPFLKRFTDPKLTSKYLAGSPALLAKLDLLGGILKTSGTEGIEEGFQEFVQIAGEEFGKIDDSEASFLNALDNVLSSDTLKRVMYSFSVGTAAGAGIATASQAPGYGVLKQQYEKQAAVTARKRETLEAQNTFLEMASDIKNTKINELAPEELKDFRRKVMSVLGVDENVWFNVDDIRAFANDPEKGSKLRNIIDPQVFRLAEENNTPVSINKGDFVGFISEFPEFSDYMKLTPESENPWAIRNEADTFTDKLNQANTRRAEVLSTLGVDQDVTPEVQAELNKAMQPLENSEYFRSETDYLENRGMISPIEGVVTPKEADNFNSAWLDAKLATAEAINNSVDRDFDVVENDITRAAVQGETESDIKFEIAQLDNELRILDSFSDTKNTSEGALAATGKHKRKGYSASAIDPRSLPEDLKEIYLNNENIKKRKVFVNGGIPLEESAALNGVESGAELLRILADTPTREKIKQNQKNNKQRAVRIRAGVEQVIKPDRMKARDDAFSNVTKLHLREMDYMTKKEFPTLKRGIIKIAGQVPTVEGLNDLAKKTISGTKIKDLNDNQFKVGERQSNKLAMDQFLKGEFEQAFQNKERAAKNNELRKETMNAQDRVEKARKFWKRVEDSTIQQELKDAGMSDVMDEFTSLYNLSSNKGMAEQESFNKWVRKQSQLGNYVPLIPEKLSDTRQTYKDLTVDQYETITEMGQYIVNQARLKNKLLKAASDRAEFRTAETIAAGVEENAKNNFKYDAKRAERESKKTADQVELEKIENGVKSTLTLFSSIESITSELDEYKINGFFYNLISAPIADATTKKRIEIEDITKEDKATIEKVYGDMKTYKEVIRQRVDVPEFANFPQLGDGEGSIRKTDLMTLQAYLGDPDGRDAIQNFVDRNGKSLTVQDVQKVLNTHLDERDAVFVQNFMINRFKRFEQRSLELHEKTTGSRPEMIKGVPFIHKGKVYPGGYFPIRRMMVPEDVRAAEFESALKEKGMGDDEGHFFAKMRAAEMTKQDRMKSRTGSKRPLDLDFNNMFQATEDIVHDLNFREVGIDLMKVMKQPHNVQNMKAVIGPKKFTTLLNSVKDVVSKTTEGERSLFAQENAKINSIIDGMNSFHAVKTIGFNLGSAAIQVDSLNYVALRAGPKTPLYLARSSKRLAANLHNYNNAVDFAATILPDIKLDQNEIEQDFIGSSKEWMAGETKFFEKYKKLQKTATRLEDIKRDIVEKSFIPVKEIDRFNKVVTTIALSEQFLNGDIEGWSKAKIDKMSDGEKLKNMRSVVKQIVDQTLTASAAKDKTPIEKSTFGKLFVRYWTDRRNRLNSILAQVDKTRGAVKRGENMKAVGHIGTLVLVAGTAQAFQNIVRDDEESLINKLKDSRNAEDVAQIALETAWDFAKAPIDQTLDTIPLVDAAKYSYEMASASRNQQVRPVSTPFLGVVTDGVMGAIALNNWLRAGLDFKRMKKKDRKALLTNAGYLVGGAPTNAIYKGMELLASRPVLKGTKFITEEIKDLNATIKEFIEEYKDVPEAQEFIQDLKEEQGRLPQFDGDVSHIIPEGSQELIREAASGGDWKAYNAETGAAGTYQFTEDRWNEIRVLNPELGLTENGRVSKDQSQQEKAMKWEMQNNTRSFMAYEIPVTTANLLGAHEFGLDNFVAIYNAKGDQKLSEVIGEEANSPIFKNYTTVQSVKRYLEKQTK